MENTGQCLTKCSSNGVLSLQLFKEINKASCSISECPGTADTGNVHTSPVFAQIVLRFVFSCKIQGE